VEQGIFKNFIRFSGGAKTRYKNGPSNKTINKVTDVFPNKKYHKLVGFTFLLMVNEYYVYKRGSCKKLSSFVFMYYVKGPRIEKLDQQETYDPSRKRA
jgi:hypothetical protein